MSFTEQIDVCLFDFVAAFKLVSKFTSVTVCLSTKVQEMLQSDLKQKINLLAECIAKVLNGAQLIMREWKCNHMCGSLSCCEPHFEKIMFDQQRFLSQL